ncbi:hypothetical protein BGW36DRAFT_406866 [Talaromyces proteolyticus]|uniref:Uncharacterized protein n=1 Tax=Talaromyces proteolyticus TaxID=1131652 RepID=A0AAD4KRW0_9EURO|nr:uncharacterized protein BGW36DRAFT_406866 [Talaromyces proteolyticus]KAH8699020.1 hypothetical protein BGW36DRAFT_406866 [Talaromyces proteolyticus]
MRFNAACVVLAAAAPAVLAAPTNAIYDKAYDFSSDLEDFYSRVSDHIKDLANHISSTGCDLSKVSLPSAASSLPTPSGTLKYVAIGRGTQNYSCADSTADTKPTQLGALATLYDASCVAANYDDLLNAVSKIVLNYDIPSSSSGTPFPPANLDMLGHHYFGDSTTPIFNLDTTAERQFGIAISKKNATMDAPTGSVAGQGNSGNGAVPWLYLNTIAGTVGNYTHVYRVNTAGGAAPNTCQGQSAQFQVQYSAQYFFYAD